MPLYTWPPVGICTTPEGPWLYCISSLTRCCAAWHSTGVAGEVLSLLSYAHGNILVCSIEIVHCMHSSLGTGIFYSVTKKSIIIIILFTVVLVWWPFHRSNLLEWQSISAGLLCPDDFYVALITEFAGCVVVSSEWLRITTKAWRSSECSDQEYTGWGFPLALLSLRPHTLQHFCSWSRWYCNELMYDWLWESGGSWFMTDYAMCRHVKMWLKRSLGKPLQTTIPKFL